MTSAFFLPSSQRLVLFLKKEITRESTTRRYVTPLAPESLVFSKEATHVSAREPYKKGNKNF